MTDEAAVGLLDVDAVEPSPIGRAARTAMSISDGGALSSSKVRKPPSREEPSGRCLTICQCPRARRRASRTRSAGISAPLASRVMARGRMRSIESQQYDQ
jgi:hypothetical protein